MFGLFQKKEEAEPIEVDNTDILCHELQKLRSVMVQNKISENQMRLILNCIKSMRDIEKEFDIYMGNNYYIVSNEENTIIERR